MSIRSKFGSNRVPVATVSKESFYRTPSYNESVLFRLSHRHKRHLCNIVAATYSGAPLTRAMIFYSLKRILHKYPVMFATLEDANEGRLNDLGEKVQVRPMNHLIFYPDLVQFHSERFTTGINELDPITKRLLQGSDTGIKFDYKSGRPLWRVHVVENLNKLLIVAHPALMDIPTLHEIQRDLLRCFNEYDAEVLAPVGASVSNSSSKHMISLRSFETKPEVVSFVKQLPKFTHSLYPDSLAYVSSGLTTKQKLKLKLSKNVAQFDQARFSRQFMKMKKYVGFVPEPAIYLGKLQNPIYLYKQLEIGSFDYTQFRNKCAHHAIEPAFAILIVFMRALNQAINTPDVVRIQYGIDLRKVSGAEFDMDGNFSQFVDLVVPMTMNGTSWDYIENIWKFVDSSLSDKKAIISDLDVLNYMTRAKEFADRKAELRDQNEVFLTYLAVDTSASSITNATFENEKYELEEVSFGSNLDCLGGSNVLNVCLNKGKANVTVGVKEMTIIDKFPEVSKTFYAEIEGLLG